MGVDHGFPRGFDMYVFPMIPAWLADALLNRWQGFVVLVQRLVRCFQRVGQNARILIGLHGLHVPFAYHRSTFGRWFFLIYVPGVPPPSADQLPDPSVEQMLCHLKIMQRGMLATREVIRQRYIRLNFESTAFMLTFLNKVKLGTFS